MYSDYKIPLGQYSFFPWIVIKCWEWYSQRASAVEHDGEHGDVDLCWAGLRLGEGRARHHVLHTSSGGQCLEKIRCTNGANRYDPFQTLYWAIITMTSTGMKRHWHLLKFGPTTKPDDMHCSQNEVGQNVILSVSDCSQFWNVCNWNITIIWQKFGLD